jgi:uncharacterized phage-associated protein
MPIPYAPLAAANFFITEFGSARGIEHMKLQKLVYCAHGWWLTANEAAFLNEKPQIWQYGPVFNSLYHVLKTFGSMPISAPQSDSPFAPPLTIDAADENVRNLLRWVWQRYGHLSSFALSDMTHRPGTAWSRVAAERNFSVPHGLEIPDAYIREEFIKMHALNSDSSELGGDKENGRGNSAA